MNNPSLSSTRSAAQASVLLSVLTLAFVALQSAPARAAYDCYVVVETHNHFWVSSVKRWMRERLGLDDTGPAHYAYGFGVCVDHDRQLLVFTTNHKFTRAFKCEPFHFAELNPVSTRTRTYYTRNVDGIEGSYQFWDNPQTAFGELTITPDVDHRAKDKGVLNVRRSVTGAPGWVPLQCPGEGKKPRLELLTEEWSK